MSVGAVSLVFYYRMSQVLTRVVLVRLRGYGRQQIFDFRRIPNVKYHFTGIRS